jgi:hypothetical protein
MTNATKTHWTTELKRENAALREALAEATKELRALGEGRLAKARRCPDQDACCDMAYRTCAEEVSRIGAAVVDRIRERMAEHGVS